MENASSKSSKEGRDESHRDAKLEEQVLRSLNGTPDVEGKLHCLLKKYVEIEKENKKLNATLKMHEKRFEAVLREKDNLQKDHNKNVLMRTKLEQVCREQQKLLKSVQSESLKHKETQAKFQHSINEISSTLNKNNEENLKLKDDNIEMAKKLKYLAEQYQVREKQFEKINEQVQLENQLHEAKLAKIQMEATIEKEILLREKQNALDDLLNSKKAIQEMQKREEELKEQLCLYTSKYDDFQTSLQKSNDIFASYKSELEKMIKKTSKLEKESADWKRKCEKSTASLLDLATEKQAKDEYILKSGKQMQQLQKLLRTLQAERTSLHKTLKDNNIEIPTMPTLPPEPEPIPVPQPKQQPDKIEAMAKNCAELKQSLAQLQSQMSNLNSQNNKKESNLGTGRSANDSLSTTSKSRNKKGKTRNKSCPTKDNKTQNEDTKKEASPVESLIDEAPKKSVQPVKNATNFIENGTELPTPLLQQELPTDLVVDAKKLTDCSKEVAMPVDEGSNAGKLVTDSQNTALTDCSKELAMTVDEISNIGKSVTDSQNTTLTEAKIDIDAIASEIATTANAAVVNNEISLDANV